MKFKIKKTLFSPPPHISFSPLFSYPNKQPTMHSDISSYWKHEQKYELNVYIQFISMLDFKTSGCRGGLGFSIPGHSEWHFVVGQSGTAAVSLCNALKIRAHFDLNLLNPTGHVVHQQFNVQQLYVLPTLYLCVLYLSENK